MTKLQIILGVLRINKIDLFFIYTTIALSR